MAPGDDTVKMTPREPSRPRIRASRPSIAPPGPNYAQLVVVDPDHYAIVRELARGGMGRVLLARDRRLGREVAVKEVIADSPTIARRFEREARITARLQHPSIIAVHEAGTWPSREPFYVMPYVTGRSFDDAIAAAKTAAQRVALLPNVLAVADAMAYAHENKVIHRDLKPRNIVIGNFGETVVLDWGLAKELDAVDSIQTARAITGSDVGASTTGDSAVGETTAGEVLGTPQYMPPEQANGLPVDARADVYSIGAILYHTLSGRPPFVGDSTIELLASVATVPPRPLRQLVPDIASELAAIVDRAMAREPAARYPTAKELADDLRAFQTGQLVSTHRYSTRQLIRRWMRRHRTLLAAIGAAAIAAVAIGVVAIRRVVAAEEVAQQERAEAQARQKDAEELMQFMLVDLEHKLQPVGKLDLLDAVARRASAYYDARGDAMSDDEAFLAATARLGVGRVIEARNDLPGALAEYDKAAAALDRLARAHPGVAKYEQRAIEVGSHRADTRLSQGDLKGALALWRELLVRAETQRQAAPSDPSVVHLVFEIRSRIAGALETQGDLAGALVEAQAALELAKQRARLEDVPAVDKDLLNAHAHVGRMLDVGKHDRAGALAEYRLGLAIGEKQVARDPHDPHWLQDVAISHDEAGQILAQQKDYAAALAEYRAGKAFAERAVAIDPTNAEMVSTVATLAEKVGIALYAQKDYAGAGDEFRASEAVWDELSKRDPSNMEWQRGKSIIANKLGDVQLAAKDTTGAIAAYKRALAVREGLVAKDATNAQWRRDLFYSHYKLASAYAAVPDEAARIAELKLAVSIAGATLAAHPTNQNYGSDVVQTEGELANLLRVGHHPDADDHYRAALAAARAMAALPDADPDFAKLADEIDRALAAH